MCTVKVHHAMDNGAHLSRWIVNSALTAVSARLFVGESLRIFYAFIEITRCNP